MTETDTAPETQCFKTSKTMNSVSNKSCLTLRYWLQDCCGFISFRIGFIINSLFLVQFTNYAGKMYR